MHVRIEPREIAVIGDQTTARTQASLLKSKRLASCCGIGPPNWFEKVHNVSIVIRARSFREGPRIDLAGPTNAKIITYVVPPTARFLMGLGQ